MSNYPLRLPDNIMIDAKELAELNGTSLNQFLSALIAERVGELKAINYIRRRGTRSDHPAALEVLSRVPDRSPVPGDELPSEL